MTAAVVNDFSNQYPPLRIKPNPDCHDRWLVLDYGLPTEQALLEEGIEKGRAEERQNTERERQRAEQERQRADKAETELANSKKN